MANDRTVRTYNGPELEDFEEDLLVVRRTIKAGTEEEEEEDE